MRTKEPAVTLNVRGHQDINIYWSFLLGYIRLKNPIILKKMKNIKYDILKVLSLIYLEERINLFFLPDTPYHFTRLLASWVYKSISECLKTSKTSSGNACPPCFCNKQQQNRIFSQSWQYRPSNESFKMSRFQDKKS